MKRNEYSMEFHFGELDEKLLSFLSDLTKNAYISIGFSYTSILNILFISVLLPTRIDGRLHYQR